MLLLLLWKTETRYLTLHPAVHTIDTMRICMRSFNCWKSLSLWNGSCFHNVNFTCLLSDIKGNEFNYGLRQLLSKKLHEPCPLQWTQIEHLHDEVSFTCCSMLFVCCCFSGFLFLLVHGIGCIISLWHYPWAFHITNGYQIIFDKLTASFCWPFEVLGYACGHRQKSATTPYDGTLWNSV